MEDMSLVSRFVDAFKRAAGRKPAVDIEEVRSTGGLGPSAPTGAFDPLRTAQRKRPRDDQVSGGDLTVKSSDPEEGGEVT